MLSNVRALTFSGALLVGTLLAAPGPVLAGDAGSAYMQSMTKMNQAMGHAPMTGDPDQDFTAMMLPHHEGAIAMAKVELQFGKDPLLRKMARDIINSQATERKTMLAWRSRHKPHGTTHH